MNSGRALSPRRERPSADAVRAALDGLVTGRALRLSERNRRFLAFVVAETLAGRGERIKAYAIGVDVFGRDETFDPGTDPIVRIEATRLRSALAAYYDGPGAEDALRIVMRPGSYMPEFEWAAPATTAVSEELSAEPRPRRSAVVVVHRTDPAERCAATRGELLVEAIVKRLVGRRVRVFLPPPPERVAAREAIHALLDDPGDVYALDVTVHAIAGGSRYGWFLSDLRSGEVRGSDTVDRADDVVPAAATIDALAEIAAACVASAIA